MKIYVTNKGITLVGKAWEITNKLKTYRNEFKTIRDWQEKTLRMKD